MPEQSDAQTFEDSTTAGADGFETAPGVRRLIVRSRPRFWPYLAGPVLVGVVYGAPSAAELASPLAVAIFAYFLVPANVYLYGINDVFDRDVDAENPKKAGREIRYRGDRFELASVVLAGLLGFALLFVVPTAAVPWFAGFLLLGTAYSAPPFRLKTVPPLDSISNGLYVLPGVGAYVVVAGTTPPLAAIVGAWLWTMAMHTFSAVPDVEPDRAAGIDTTATVLGESRTLAYCALTWTAAAAAFWLLSPAAGALLGIYPLLVGAIAAANVDVDRAYWWYPAINTLVGMVLTLAGLWRLTGA